MILGSLSVLRSNALSTDQNAARGLLSDTAEGPVAAVAEEDEPESEEEERKQ